MQHLAFIGLGSNLEDPRSQLQRAFAALGELPGTRLVAQSSLYRSAPLGYPD
ncbi:MAG: 2-amino-4-hydroxy-6-hydroxymethyldihydropteridine diphosphokinase, partial [Gallionella sp.]